MLLTATLLGLIAALGILDGRLLGAHMLLALLYATGLLELRAPAAYGLCLRNVASPEAHLSGPNGAGARPAASSGAV